MAKNKNLIVASQIPLKKSFNSQKSDGLQSRQISTFSSEQASFFRVTLSVDDPLKSAKIV
jgi:hypothetical protein